MTADQIKDRLWAEIRQIVLNEGPAAEELTASMREHGIEDECREGIAAELIAFRCAEIESLSYGPLQGTPVALVCGSWAGNLMQWGLASHD
jgi:hypothetical protein